MTGAMARPPPKFLNFEESCWNNWDKVKVVLLIAMRS